ncbi:MAG: yabD [Bacilli bacterium]|nr:yabD [Bacilli bacterium]
MIFDTHCHLNDEQFAEDYMEMIEKAKLNQVTQIAIPGFDRASSLKAIAIAQQVKECYAIIGYHPNDGIHVTEESYSELAELAKQPKVVAIGEIGLDYHWDTTAREIQAQVFRAQIQLAKAQKLPIVIHDRDAHADVVRILQEENASEVGGIMHCYSGSIEMARTCMDMNFRISFGGPVTFKNAKRPQEVVKEIPLDYLLVETDSPYLCPEPHRGQRNEPAYVTFVARKIAELRGMEYEELGAATTRNAEQLFQNDRTI